MTSRSKVVSASQKGGGGKKGAKSEISKKPRKSSTSSSSSELDENDEYDAVKRAILLKVWPKKEKIESKGQPQKILEKKSKVKEKESSDDEEKVESDEKINWRGEIKRIGKLSMKWN